MATTGCTAYILCRELSDVLSTVDVLHRIAVITDNMLVFISRLHIPSNRREQRTYGSYMITRIWQLSWTRTLSLFGLQFPSALGDIDGRSW